jgi:hypothetical protein
MTTFDQGFCQQCFFNRFPRPRLRRGAYTNRTAALLRLE